MAASMRRTAYHFNVTCPFWTRFMLNPTVGMELLMDQSRTKYKRMRDGAAG